LLVTDDDGEESPPFPRRFSLKPNQPPVADFERTPDNGPAPLIVKFTTTSTDPDPDDASSLRFSWDFGDNQPGSTVTTTSKTYDYVYKSRGEYFVRLIASDGRLESSPVIKTVSVR
jgi:PKD repeat protein